MNRIIKIYNSIKDAVLIPIKQNCALFLFSLIMCYLITAIGFCVEIEHNIFVSFLLPIFDCYIVCIIATLLKKIHLQKVWILIIAILFFAELFTEFYYHSEFTTFVLQLVLETGKRESYEFVREAIFTAPTWYSIGIIISAIAATYGIKKIATTNFKYRQAIIFIIFALIVWSGIRQISDYAKLWRCFTSLTIEDCANKKNHVHQNSPFMRLLYGIAFNKASSNELDILGKTVASTTIEQCDFKSPLIVLIIGESFNKYHSSLYRYNLPTSQRLSKRKENGNLYTFDDVVCPFNLTSQAFRSMFSTWDDECQDSWLQHTLFPAVFKKAGYKVYFITNQFTVKDGDFHDVVGGTILNHPTLSKLQFDYRNSQSYKYDHELISEIPSIDTLTSSPSLLIFHIKGQHQDYSEKYPKEYSRFSADDEQTPFGGDVGKEIAAHYDNATLYNDHVIDSIFSIIENTEAVAIYLSDHGEEIYDWRAKFHRTNEENMPPEVAKYQYEIPFMIYMTNSYIDKHRDILQSVSSSAHRPFISSDICHLLFHLAGIRCADYQESKDIISVNYNTNRKRIINNHVDYDKLISTISKGK